MTINSLYRGYWVGNVCLRSVFLVHQNLHVLMAFVGGSHFILMTSDAFKCNYVLGFNFNVQVIPSVLGNALLYAAESSFY